MFEVRSNPIQVLVELQEFLGIAGLLESPDSSVR